MTGERLTGSGSRLFLTGGSGYIGRNLIRACVAKGINVVALARSEAAAQTVSSLGAKAVRGDILAPVSLEQLIKGCSGLIHAAADTNHGFGGQAQAKANRDGARAVLAAARAAGVRRAVHLSTEAVLLDGRPLRRATEAMPYPGRPAGAYSLTKRDAEIIALGAADAGLDVMVVRPRFVWGRDDTSALPALITAARTGKLTWIDGGRYLTSTTHVANACEGLLLALERGRSGQVYFLCDDHPVVFRDWVTRLLAVSGASAPTAAIPSWIVHPLARLGDVAANLTRGAIRGPISFQEYATLGVEVTLDISKARRELGYQQVITRQEGLAELEAGSWRASSAP